MLVLPHGDGRGCTANNVEVRDMQCPSVPPDQEASHEQRRGSLLGYLVCAVAAPSITRHGCTLSCLSLTHSTRHSAASVQDAVQLPLHLAFFEGSGDLAEAANESNDEYATESDI